MRLFDFVEEDDRVGTAAHGLGQLAAFVVADVARRRADEASHGVLLHVLAHVDAHHGLLVVEEELGQGAGGFGFAHAGGSKKNERADGPLGIAEAGARTANGVGDHGERGILADDALAQAVFHLDELLHFAFQHARDGNAGPLADDLGDVFFVDFFLQHARRLRPCRSVLRGVQLLQLGFELGQFAVLDLRGAVELALAGLLFGFEAQGFDLLFQFADAADRFALLGPAGAQGGDLLFERGQLALDDLAAARCCWSRSRA